MIRNIASDSCASALKVDTERLMNLDRYCKETLANGTHAFSSIRVLRNGIEIFNGTYGTRSPGGLPLSDKTIFPVASVTKSFIATMLAILQEEGRIDLWDKVQTHFPEFTGEGKDLVELWQIMCHSSGMSDEAMESFVMVYLNDLGIEIKSDCSYEEYSDAILLARDKMGLPAADRSSAISDTERYIKLKAPLSTEPHTAFSYCNFGFELLAHLIQRITGESLDSYASRKIFRPLGMEDTYWVMPKSKWSRIVKLDESFYYAGWFNSDSILTSTSGAGGLKTTMKDLTLFGQMYLQEGVLGNARVLSPASVRLLTSNHNSGMPASFWYGRWLGCAWGLGWDVRGDKKDDLGILRSSRAFDHAGSGGVRLLIDPEYGLVASFYLLDQTEESFTSHSRVANIIYSSLC